MEIEYNPDIPIEYIDVIIIEECHRSIYKLWWQVLEYFDAFLIGMMSTTIAKAKKTIYIFLETRTPELCISWWYYADKYC